MAQLIINIPDNQVARVVTALAARWNYDDNALPGETPRQFIERQFREYLRRNVLRAEQDELLRDFNFEDPGIQRPLNQPPGKG